MVKALSILLLSFSISSLAQTTYTGTPNIRNFPKSEYNAGTQNWAISQDNNGFIYVANNDGLLSYDGVRWDLIEISSTLPLRSICIDTKNSIYVGMFNDFGIIKREEPNKPVFQSFKHLLPDGYEEFDDVWRIHELDDGIVFQCFKYLFLYKNNKITVIEPRKSFLFSFKLGNRLFLQEPDLGVFELSEDKLIKLPFWDQHKEMDISTIMTLGENKILIGTAYNGIFIREDNEIREWDTPVNDFLLRNSLYSGTTLQDRYLVFGTILNGLVISDLDGNIVQSLTIEQGIQNRTVLSLFVDRNDGLWLGLDNGIDYIETNSPLSYIGSRKLGTGYCCKIFKGNLYLGTNQGLFVRPYNISSLNQDFELVENTEGQVWSLDEFDGELICGHNQGTFRISGKYAEIISNEEGAWKYITLKDKPEYLLGGHYQGLVLLKKEGGQWKSFKKIKGFYESSRYLFQDEYGDIWIGHGGRGIFRLSLNKEFDAAENVEHYTIKNGLPSNTGNLLFAYNNSIYVSTDSGIYYYERISGSFKLSAQMNEMLGNSGKVKCVVTDKNGNEWYIADKESGVILQADYMPETIINIPFRKLNNKYVHEFENIYPYGDNSVFFGVEDGLVHYSMTFPKYYTKTFKSFITKVEFQQIDSVLYIEPKSSDTNYKFPYGMNSFRFHFAAPFFENETPLRFSYFLEGFSDNWSAWSYDNYKDFTLLREGNYRLKLRSKNIYDIESDLVFLDFEITPPWQRTIIAYFVYIILFLSFLILLIKYVLDQKNQSQLREKQRYQEEMQRKEEKFQHEALIAEKEIINLRNERLKDEIVYRNKELSNQTMGIIQKNKFLMRVNEDLNSIQDFIVNDKAKEKIYGLKNRIKKEIDIKQQNKIFESYFDKVHEEFFARLKEKYSDSDNQRSEIMCIYQNEYFNQRNSYNIKYFL